MVLLGVGVTVKTPCLVVVPPNVAIRLATNGQSPVEQRSMRRVVLWADSYVRRFGCLATLGECVEVLGFTCEPNREKYRD